MEGQDIAVVIPSASSIVEPKRKPKQNKLDPTLTNRFTNFINDPINIFINP